MAVLPNAISRIDDLDAYNQIVRQVVQQHREAELHAEALRLGETAPEFALLGANGRSWCLADHLQSGPVVVAFYRGGWCLHCCVRLRMLSAAHEDIAAAGARLAAISLASHDAVHAPGRFLPITFDLLYDRGGRTAKLFGVQYTLSSAHAAALAGIGIDLRSEHASEQVALPLTATYVIGRDGVVKYAHVDVDPACFADTAKIIDLLRSRRLTDGACLGGAAAHPGNVS